MTKKLKRGRPKAIFPCDKMMMLKLNIFEKMMLDYLQNQTGLAKGTLIKRLIKEQFRGRIRDRFIKEISKRLKKKISEEEVFK